MEILHLTLKKEFFDMIASGEKKEEYREIKPYWDKRLSIPLQPFVFHPAKYDVIKFVNGYGKDKPTMIVECLGIKVDYTKPELAGGWDDLAYVIKLGKILEIRNYGSNI